MALAATQLSNTHAPPKILLIDDEEDYRALAMSILEDEYDILSASTGEEGIRVAQANSPDIVLVDILMRDMDGISVCERLRSSERTRHVPILMLTAAFDVESRIRAFSAGADDFIAKPYTDRELLSRIASKLRRVREQSMRTNRSLSCGNLTLDLCRFEAAIAGERIVLTALEFNLLRYMIENQDRVMNRKTILQSNWAGCNVTSRTVDTHVSALRKKLKGFDHDLSAIYRIGYILRNRYLLGDRDTMDLSSGAHR